MLAHSLSPTRSNSLACCWLQLTATERHVNSASSRSLRSTVERAQPLCYLHRQATVAAAATAAAAATVIIFACLLFMSSNDLFLAWLRRQQRAAGSGSARLCRVKACGFVWIYACCLPRSLCCAAAATVATVCTRRLLDARVYVCVCVCEQADKMLRQQSCEVFSMVNGKW